jgi:hypothetical protein
MSTSTPPPADPTPDREERELAALYRKLPPAEPDEALDAHILEQARRATRRPSRYRGLLVGFASVAGLVMAAGVTWHLYGSRHAPAPDRSASPSALKSRRVAPSRQVVPVHVLSAKQASNRTDEALQREPMENRAANAAAAAPARPVTDRETPLPAPALIAQARQALAQEDVGRARMLVRRIVRRHPDLKLPPDLAPYAPNADAATGSP